MFLQRLYIIRIQRDKMRRYKGSQPETKSGHRSANKAPVCRDISYSIGSKRISFVRSSEDSFKTVFFDTLKSLKNDYYPGEAICRRLFLLRSLRLAAPSRAVSSRPACVTSDF